MKKTSVISLVALLFLFLTSLYVPAAHAVTLTRNTTFNSGLASWNINPDISAPAWTPLVTHPDTGNAVNLHPEGGYTGTVIYQNLKVSGIANTVVNLSVSLTQNFAPAGKTIAVYIDYVDNSNVVHKIKVLNPDNSSITSNTLVSGTYTFPADARKLVKIEIAKENYGEFIIDNIVLSSTAAVTVSAVPVISSITPASGPHGQMFVIAGGNFTSVKGKVLVAGSQTGVTINSWTNTQIEFTTQDPVQSGMVNVISDFVESNIDKTIEITSPGYSIRLPVDSAVVVMGETAEFIVRADFLKGFTTSGISFSVDGNAALASNAAFTPAPLKNSGGAVLKINTATLANGVYQASVKAVEGTLAPRYVPFTLEVVTIPVIKFYELDWSGNKVYITSKSITQQGQIIDVFVEAIDSNGVDRGLQADLQSSSPSILGIYKRMFGYQINANDSGTANLTASTPDGRTAALPITIAISNPKITSLSVTSPVANTNSGPLTFSVISSNPITSIGYDNSGMVDFGASDFFTNLDYAADYLSAGSVFHMSTLPADLGTVLFNASTTGAIRVVPLEIVNGPSTAEIGGTVRIIDNTFAEGFVLELYSTSTTKVFTKKMFLMPGIRTFAVGGIPPGTYRVRISSDPTAVEKIEPQWYPNARSYAAASPVTFTAGQAVQNIDFFLRTKTAGPGIEVSPAGLSFSNVPVGTTSASQKITIHNRGTSSLAITSVSITGAGSSRFSQTNNCTSVAVNGSCTANVTFSPNGVGAVSAFLNIQSNDPDSPVVDLLLAGSGTSNLPAAPTLLTAKATGPAQVFIGWKDNAANETGFKIERKPGACAAAGTWAEIGTVGANVASYNNTGLNSNTAFSYKVRAYNASGHSSYTACVTATTGLAGAPNSPSGFKATSAGAGKVNLAWTDNSADETGFQIFRKTGTGAFTLLKTVAGSPASDATASGNTTATAYEYYVKACNASGCSPAASVASVPFAPAAFTALAASATRVNLQWTDSSSNETGFQVERKSGNCTSAGAWTLNKTLTAGTTLYSDMTAVSGQTYAYRLRAYTQSASRPYAYGYSSYATCREVTMP